MQIENEQIKKNCTFKPIIKEREHSVVRASSASGLKDPLRTMNERDSSFNRLEDRLHHEADKKHENRERLRRKLEEEKMAECPFKPQLMKSSQQ
jgi:hypothetical protein